MDSNEISRRRMTGFIVLAVAIVIGTLAFGVVMASCQPTATPSLSPTPSEGASATAFPSGGSSTVAPGASATPQGSSPAATTELSPTPLAPSVAPTRRPTQTTTPGDPGPSIEIPPPIR